MLFFRDACVVNMMNDEGSEEVWRKFSMSDNGEIVYCLVVEILKCSTLSLFKLPGGNSKGI